MGVGQNEADRIIQNLTLYEKECGWKLQGHLHVVLPIKLARKAMASF